MEGYVYANLEVRLTKENIITVINPEEADEMGHQHEHVRWNPNAACTS